MLPYFAQPRLPLGPLSIHAFGVLVAIAVILGVRILGARAAAVGIAQRDAARFVNWILVGGFLGAHLFDRLVYFPRETMADPLTLVMVWQGLSSFGGFVGGTLAATIFFRRHARPGTPWLYVESFAYAFPFGWVFGRLGCFMAYDHPGRETRFVLGQMYKDHVVRHNLGLYEALYAAVIAALFFVLGRKQRKPGFFLGCFLVLYAPFRFALDFWRIVDVRYGGLTPGQYGCVALLALGCFLLFRLVSLPVAAPPLGRLPARQADRG